MQARLPRIQRSAGGVAGRRVGVADIAWLGRRCERGELSSLSDSDWEVRLAPWQLLSMPLIAALPRDLEDARPQLGGGHNNDVAPDLAVVPVARFPSVEHTPCWNRLKLPCLR